MLALAMHTYHDAMTTQPGDLPCRPMRVSVLRWQQRPLIASYAQLLTQLAPHSNPRQTQQQIERCLRQAHSYILVASWADTDTDTTAEQPATVLGGLSLSWYDHPLGRRGWIEDVVVDQALRRQGIARALMRRAKRLAQSCAISQLQLTSRPHRQAAHATYHSLRDDGWQAVDSTVFRCSL